MTPRDQWVDALVVAAKELFQDGVDDPSAEELVEHYYEDKVFPASMVDDAIKRMGRVRRALEEDGYRTAPVAEKYYRRTWVNNRPKAVEDLADAALQLASGHGKRCCGLVHFTGQDESHALIWQAWQRLQTNRNGAALGKDIQKVLDAVSDGELSEAEARATLETGVLAATRDPELLGQVMTAELEPGDGKGGEE